MKKTIWIKKGPQFGRKMSIIFLLISIALFFPGVNLLNSDSLLSAACFAGIVLLMPIFLDYQGVEIDMKNQRIRSYRSYLGLKWGTWVSMVGLDEIELKWERIQYRSGGSVTTMIVGGKATSRQSDVFVIYLVDFLHGIRFEMADFGTYKGARSFMNKYAKTLGLSRNDTYAVVKEKAMQRRNEVEFRRKR